MGMFDNIKCKYKLPIDMDLSNEIFQTKDTPAQFIDDYEILEDGVLWHKAYDIIDKSDPTAEGIKRLHGLLTKTNERWETMNSFTGEIRFYTYINDKGIEFSSYFHKGKLKELHLIEERKDT